MGYRSSVYLRFDETIMPVVLAARKLDKVLDKILGDSDLESTDCHTDFQWASQRNWGPCSCPEVEALLHFLSELPDENYGYIRIGEESTDLEEMGAPWEYDMYVQQVIEW
jgi:hypothetical protein